MSVIFDCSSSLAMFRKPYTTTSSVSFAFPPPTAVAGLIGAIVGLDNGSTQDASSALYWGQFSGTSIAVSIRKPIRWLRAALNFWNVKNPQSSPHIQVKHQFVASPQYRIYVKGSMENTLRQRLENESFVYTPFLGVAYALASVDYVGHCDDIPVETGAVCIDSVVPWNNAESCGIELNLSGSTKLFKEIVPLRLSEKRALIESVNVLYSNLGQVALKQRGELNVTRCLARGMEDVVAWFPEW